MIMAATPPPPPTQVCFDHGSYVMYDKEVIKKSPAGELLPKVGRCGTTRDFRLGAGVGG